ncbi:SusC/RagA family TonB-linked outer membrane protein [Pontibacter silvestris]|uniref:SusC/RagA family TonB-linked outer membrane protein n=1 Tax=Pontibacter silvestris TaxID=2305183 RepID=A0ABW4WZ35_9BACT|nr:TonB-dependent receptor [Pontibacter silvestris]MCC9137593.1 TonB-dependent receptor [Pontibacter silvestris]
MMKNMYALREYLTSIPVSKHLSGWKVALMLLAILLLQGVCSFAQSTQPINGRVVSSENNQGLPGVSIGVKGTANGAITDAEGNFTLQAASDAVLVVSYIGFTAQEVPVRGRSNITVSLTPDQKVLDEVVVTGYGELRRSDITGAQTTIGAEQIEKTVNTTIEQAIQGRAAGVYVTQNTGAPGGGISVNIRGVNSINGSNEPLYVIDGVQIEGSNSATGSNPLATLNPSDIESMEVLQGPSATAVYGSRGTNGVVLITTKRGKAGETRINYSFMYSLQMPPNELEVMNLRQYAQMDNEYKSIAGGTVREEFLDPSILGEGTNWQDELFKSAPMQKHQLSVSGGSEKTTYYLSGEYLDQEGIAIGSGFDRYSVRLNLDSKVKKWLTINGNFNYAQTNEQLSTTQSNIISTAIQLPPHIPVRNINGSYGGGTVTSDNTAEQFTPPNPIGLANITTNDLTRRQVLGGIKLGFHIIEGLDFNTSLNGNVNYSNSTYFLPTYQFGYQRNETATLNNTNGINTYLNWNQMLQYQKQFGKHSLNVMASHESQESTWKNLYGERRGFQTNDILDLNAGDVLTSVANGGQGDWAMESYLGRVNYNYGDRYILQAAFRADGSVNFGPENRWGYFPSVSAAWRLSEEDFFNVTFVSDLRLRYEIGLTGSQGQGGAIYGTLSPGPTPWGTGFLPNRYPNPEYQWEETKTNNVGINLGLFENRVQIEADYYIKDTDNLILQSTLPWYMGTNGSGSIAPPTVNVGSLQNKGWSITLNTINIDNGSFTWGSNFNISHFKTELTALTSENSLLNRTTREWNEWTQRSIVGQAPWLFYGYIEEGIFQSVEELQESALPADNNGNEYAIAENSIWVGDVKYKDVNGDGIINGDDQTFIGNPWPKYYAGFTNNFSYKGFDLSVLITSTIGNDIYNYLRRENTNPNNINLGRNLFVDAFNYADVAYRDDDPDHLDPYLTNPGTNVARMSGGNKNSNFERHTDKFVEDGSFVRLKNITLSYNLSPSMLSKLRYIKGARIGVSAQNVATITGYSGYDPEVGSHVGGLENPNSAAIGVDYGRYPLTPVYSVNIGIDF